MNTTASKSQKGSKSPLKNLFIILDSNAIMHRSYHALPPLTTRDGELVNAVFGFASILMTILTQEQPQYIAAAFDTAAPTFRHEKYEDYKAGREKAPDDFYNQIPRIEQVIEMLNIPILKQDGVEADDIIGTIVKTNEKQHPKLHNKIVTSDMDAMQLVTKKTCVGTLYKGYKASQCFFPEDVVEKYEITPEQVVDYKALQGDPSDNIPGVKGIGKKGAVTLLTEFGSLDGIYENLEKIKGKKQELLREQKEQAYFSQDLATIKTDVEIDFDINDAKAIEFNEKKITKLFDSLQFYSLIRRLQTWKKSHGIASSEISDVFGTEQKNPSKKGNNEQKQLF